MQGTEPFEFDEVMEHVYSPGPDLMFIDNSIVEHAGKVWNFHVVGNPEDLEKADPRIRKLKYEYNGYAIGNTLFDFEYQGLILDKPQGEWDCITTGLAVNINRFRDGFVVVYTGVGLRGTRNGAAFSKNLLDWEPHPDNPVIPPPSWAEPYGACKDNHILLLDGRYFVYYVVTMKGWGPAIALAITEDWERFEFHPEPVFQFPSALRGTSSIESVGVILREGIFHLFFCCGQGTWHTLSDNPYEFLGANGVYLMGPFVAPEIFQWNGEWWLSSTKKRSYGGWIAG